MTENVQSGKWFENDVILYGGQTDIPGGCWN